MGLEKAFSYYGRLDGIPPIRDFKDELIQESKAMLQVELREMEERLRRFMTENKKEIVRRIDAALSYVREKTIPQKKEVKYVSVKPKRSIKSDRE